MSIKANVCTDVYGNITIMMKGDLDYENSIPLRQELQGLVQNNPWSTIILDMNGVDFVGASGIGNFVETLRLLNRKKAGHVQLTNVKGEFLKVFKLYGQNDGDILIKGQEAAELFDDFDTDDTNVGHYAGRKHTFAN